MFNKCCNICCPPVCCCPPQPGPPQVGSFTLIKRDANNLLPLEGVIFTLFQDGNPVAQTTSNSQGQIIFNNLTPGVYALRETQTLPGYQRNMEPWQITIDQSGAVSIDGNLSEGFSIDNARSYSFILRKRAARVLTNLPGVTYTLSQNGNTVATATSSNTGLVIFYNLSPGIYTLKEVAAPPGFMIDGATYVVTITQLGDALFDDQAWPPVLYNSPYLTLHLRKLSTVTEAPLSNAEFTIFQGDEIISVLTTDSNGLASFEFTRSGEYTLIESRPPNGYAPDTTVYNVYADNYGYLSIWSDFEYFDVTEQVFDIYNTPL